MAQQTYNLGFTASSLRLQEALKIAALYVEHRNWKVVRDRVITENQLQQRTASSSNRLFRELSSRLKHLADDEIVAFVEGPDTQRLYLLWLATRRRYAFLQEFFVEVVKEHHRNLNYRLEYADFDIFFNAKMDLHDELSEITDTTRRKIRQVTFRMMRETGLLNSDNTINPVSELLRTDSGSTLENCN